MATSSGPVEMDAMFIKALKLLHSRHPDSLEQLRALRDEAIRQYSQQVPPSKTAKVLDSSSESNQQLYYTSTYSNMLISQKKTSSVNKLYIRIIILHEM